MIYRPLVMREFFGRVTFVKKTANIQSTVSPGLSTTIVGNFGEVIASQLEIEGEKVKRNRGLYLVFDRVFIWVNSILH